MRGFPWINDIIDVSFHRGTLPANHTFIKFNFGILFIWIIGYPVAEYVFKHPLTQDVALGSQLLDRRRRVHAAVARAIEAMSAEKLDEQAALLAYHWEEAGEAPEATRWYGRAAEWVGKSDPIEGVRHWQKVRELGRKAPETEEAASLRLDACRSILSMGGWRMGIR